ncbi:MAG: hypothetical protein D6778_00360 [Nitrospirae bacterium]|nr:MAG: hypothetical protein D6778_00360 [Nitrospirota bacterium]
MAMKIAVTADLHLREDRPERLRALRGILSTIHEEGITHLIIAGDLFDRETTNYGFFESVTREFPELHFYIIPGNHDSGLSGRNLGRSNITVYTEPTFLKIGPVDILFLPYRSNSLMDEVLTEVLGRAEVPTRWILFGHGDYIGGYHQPHSYEKGIYMPLSARAIENFRPQKVILGHIHKPHWQGLGRVYYPGSPCGLDINETGQRGFLILDLDILEVHPRVLVPEVLYFVESVWVYPVEEEVSLLETSLQKMIESWGLEEETLKKVVLRLQLKGYTQDRPRVIEKVKEFLSKRGIRLYDDGEPVVTELETILEDPYYDERQRLLKRVKSAIDNLQLQEIDQGQLGRDDILGEVLDILYGR